MCVCVCVCVRERERERERARERERELKCFGREMNTTVNLYFVITNIPEITLQSNNMLC